MRTILASIALVLTSVVSTDVLAQYEVSVNSLAAPGAEEKRTYALIPEDDSVDTGSLQYQEYEQLAKLALSRAGFVESETANEADVLVLLAYGIGEPQRWVAGSSSRTRGEVSSVGNSTAISATTITTQSNRTAYTRHVRLTAIDYQRYLQTKNVVEVWQTTAVSTGSSGDLRQVFPAMLVKSYPYFGKSTKKAATHRVSDWNRDLRSLRDGR